ncbi:MAG: HIT family protein [Candidatus Lokiarchaeota archaeon]|nr:HIT family protein [Candidatus Lokiarchaeota archaeon]
MVGCIFCKIIKGEIPSVKLYETNHSYAMLDINPLSEGHALIIPKEHAEKMHQLSDESLTDILIIAKRLALAENLVDYNILQNNGYNAHQRVMHVHFHVIPKTQKEGLIVPWDPKKTNLEDLKKLGENIKKNL